MYHNIGTGWGFSNERGFYLTGETELTYSHKDLYCSTYYYYIPSHGHVQHNGVYLNIEMGRRKAK